MHNDCALKEFIQGEERCLKFINQDLTFLQESHIPSTFTNVSHTTSLKELVHINLPTCTSNKHSSTENTASSRTQSVQPTLAFTPAKVCRAEHNPTLTVPQLLEIEPCREYTETPLKIFHAQQQRKDGKEAKFVNFSRERHEFPALQPSTQQNL